MARLAIASQKGGAGKTTLALNLAQALARLGHRTLLVDTDPQGSIGLSLARKHGASRGLAEYLGRRASLGEVVLKTRLENLHLLLVGGVGAAEIDDYTLALGAPDGLARLADEASSHFDLLVFDTPSGLGGVTRRVLEQASHVVAPVQAEPLALRSLGQLLDVVGAVRSGGHDLALAGLVLFMLQVRNEHSLGVAQELWSQLPAGLLLDATVPRDPVFLAAGAAGVPLGLLSRTPPPQARVFEQIALELEPRLGFSREEADDGPIDLLV
jgi:chromosome partitioning protein